MKRFYKFIVLSVLSTMATGSAMAIDIGLPGLPDGTGTMGVELFYQNFKRAIKQDSDVGTSFTTDQEERRIAGRLNYMVTPKMLLHVDLGITNPETDDHCTTDNEFFFGAGISYQVYANELMNLNVFGSFDYIPGITYQHETYTTTIDGVINEYGAGPQKENYYEIAVGVVVSKDIPVGGVGILLPYAGLELSKLHGNEDYDYTYSWGETLKSSGNIDDDGIFSVILGSGFVFNNGIGLRLEGQFISQTSISFGVMYNF